MKAIVKSGEGPEGWGVREMEKPVPGPGEVLVRMRATGVCHTDLFIIEDKYRGRRPLPPDLIIGHEGAGEVAALGPGVTGLAVGDRVALEVLEGCGRCPSCLDGHKNMCLDWVHYGITCDGTFAEYMKMPAALCHRLPDSVTWESAAILEPLSLVVATLRHVKPLLGDTVAIIGPGAIGLLHLQAFRSAGAAKVIMVGVEQDEKRFRIAETLGADACVNLTREDAAEAVRRLTGGRGADIVVETASHPAATKLAIECAGPLGRVRLFGLHPEAVISPLHLLRNGLTVYGDVAITSSNFARALTWVEYGKVRGEPLITRRFRLDEAKEAFQAAHRGDSPKVLFEM